MPFVRVAVPVPALDALTYRVPDELPMPAIGARVLVPLGTRIVTGLVVGPSDEPAAPAGACGPSEARSRRASARGGGAPRALSNADSAAGSPGGPATIRDLVDVLDSQPFLPE